MRAHWTLALLPIVAFPASDAAAQGPWEEPITVDRGSVSSPAVAIDATGRIAAAWTRAAGDTSAIRAIAEPAAGPITVEQSSGPRLADPAIASTPRVAVVTWTRRGRVETRRVSRRTGAVSLLARLSPAGSTAVGPTWIGGTGGSVLGWLLGRSTLQMALPLADGRFDRTVRYSIDGLQAVDAVTTRGGGLLAAFTCERFGVRQLMVAEQRPGSARLVEFARMTTRGVPANPVVTVTRSGRSIVGWTEGGRVAIAERPRGGAFGVPVYLQAAGGATSLALVAKADGTVLASWLNGDGELQVVDVRGGPARTLTRSDESIADYTVAADGRGLAHFGWIARGAVTVRVVDARERIGASRRLSASGERARAFALSASTRHAAALWTTANSVRMSRRQP